MLTRLDIKDFALVEALVVDFASGFSAITGETGAGKSIMLDALGLVLGDRASPELIRSGASAADLSAEFSVTGIAGALHWLESRELSDPDAPESCLLRRTLGADGRSRAYVNGRPVTLQDIRDLAEHLIDIHSQHAHQSLLRRDTQRLLLDEFGGHGQLVRDLTRTHGHWRSSVEALEACQRAQAESAERRALLSYQMEELDRLNLTEGEFPELVSQQKRLAHADAHARRLATTLAGLDEDDDAVTALLGRLLHALEDIEDDHPALTTARELLDSARVNCEEATSELRRYADLLEPDPERLEIIDARLGELHDLARKHRIRPEELSALQQSIADELTGMADGESRLEALAQTVAEARAAMLELATKVSKARAKAARKLEAAVTGQLVELGMKHARFEAHLETLDDGECGPTGLERVDFRVSANKGVAPGPLGKIASGGELSRISLAIQVVTAATSRIPSLILDEADVGIGGRTAEVVGRLLRNLGDHTQILAVTHLPQVAALAHQHLAVEKSDQDSARVTIRTLDEDERVGELARMLGGVEVTAQTRAHANEMRTRAASA
ncbi:MAG: DNA repair protein RecN [Gammaproteobacteria bacterium]|nr:DNA repair protein RecN [Gammaproteobacteria bacterium]